MKILLLSWLHRKLVYGQEKEMLVFVVLHLIWRVLMYQYNKVGSWKNLSPIWTPNKPLHRLHFDIGIPQNVCLGNYTKKLLFLPWGIGLYYMCWCFLLRRLKCWRRNGKMNWKLKPIKRKNPKAKKVQNERWKRRSPENISVVRVFLNSLIML